MKLKRWKCPRCEGKGSLAARVAPGHPWTRIECITCRGTGLRFCDKCSERPATRKFRLPGMAYVWHACQECIHPSEEGYPNA